MRVKILVEVIGDDGRKVRKQKSTEVPSAVLKSHSIVCESQDDLLGFILNDVVSSAIGAVSRPQAPQVALEEALMKPSSSGSGSPNKLEAMLGLDIIDHMDGVEARKGGGQRKMTPGDLAIPQAGTRR